jgi:hypothetical protein
MYSQEARLVASDGINFDNFGRAVAISGGTAAIGAPNQGSGLGAVYLLERSVSDWAEVQKIVAPDGVATDQFGSSVAISGNTLVISAPGKKRPQDQLLSAGYVYVYERTGGTWSLDQTIVPSDAYAGLFGTSVAVRSGVIAIGIEGKGRAVIYEQSGGEWVMTGDIVPDPTGTGDSFGNEVALAEELLVVGARSADVDGRRAAGAAYVFAPPGSTDGPMIPDGVRR